MKPSFSHRKRYRAVWATFSRIGRGLWVAPSVLLTTTEHAWANAEQQRVVVLSHDTAPDSLESSFVSALRSYFTELELSLDVRPAPASASPFDVVAELRASTNLSDALMVAWIVPQKPRIIVYIYEPKGPRLRARAVSISGSSVVASEELALILRSSILARREGGELEMAEVVLPSAAVKPKPESAPVSAAGTVSAQQRSTEQAPREGLRFGLFAGFAYDHVMSAGGGNAGLGLRALARSGRTRLGLGYVVLPASSLRSDMAEFAVSRHPIQAILGQQLVVGSPRLVAELTFSADPMRRRTGWVEAPLEAEPPSWRWGWSLGGLLRGEVHLFSGMWLSSGAGAEIALNPFSFERNWLGDHRILARILPVRPVLDLGLVWVMR